MIKNSKRYSYWGKETLPVELFLTWCSSLFLLICCRCKQVLCWKNVCCLWFLHFILLNLQDSKLIFGQNCLSFVALEYFKRLSMMIFLKSLHFKQVCGFMGPEGQQEVVQTWSSPSLSSCVRHFTKNTSAAPSVLTCQTCNLHTAYSGN